MLPSPFFLSPGPVPATPQCSPEPDVLSLPPSLCTQLKEGLWLVLFFHCVLTPRGTSAVRGLGKYGGSIPGAWKWRLEMMARGAPQQRSDRTLRKLREKRRALTGKAGGEGKRGRGCGKANGMESRSVCSGHTEEWGCCVMGPLLLGYTLAGLAMFFVIPGHTDEKSVITPTVTPSDLGPEIPQTLVWFCVAITVPT